MGRPDIDSFEAALIREDRTKGFKGLMFPANDQKNDSRPWSFGCPFPHERFLEAMQIRLVWLGPVGAKAPRPDLLSM